MKYSKFLIALAAILIIAGLYGCNLTTTSTKKMVTPEIRAIGLPSFDIVDSVTLKVSGPGMNTVEVSYSVIPSVINLAIPEGDNRTFELTVYMGAAYTGTVASYKGSATADITSDGTVVTLNMSIGRTKIVIPDANNNRIVQIDNMTGAGWLTRTWTDLGYHEAYEFEPYDVDIDQYGNIYIANNASDSLYSGIIKIPSIEFSTLIPVPTYIVSGSPVQAVAIDHNSDRVYGISENMVYYWDTLGNSTGGITVSGSPVGLAVDDDGNVYVSGTIAVQVLQSWIEKYSGTGVKLLTYIGEVGETINDITISNGELYATITNSSTGTTARIEKFDPNTLQHPDGDFSFGQWADGSETLGSWDFLGPYNFLATMNNELTMIDYQSSDEDFARLVSFNAIDGDGWTVFGQFGSGENQFGFFY